MVGCSFFEIAVLFDTEGYYYFLRMASSDVSAYKQQSSGGPDLHVELFVVWLDGQENVAKNAKFRFGQATHETRIFHLGFF